MNTHGAHCMGLIRQTIEGGYEFWDLSPGVYLYTYRECTHIWFWWWRGCFPKQRRRFLGFSSGKVRVESGILFPFPICAASARYIFVLT